MTKHDRLWCVSPWAAAALLVFSGLAGAQQTAEDAAQSPAPVNTEELDAQVQRIATSIAEYERLVELAAQVNPGYQVLLRRRLDQRENEVFELVDSLADDILALQQQGEAVDEYRARIIIWLDNLVLHITEFLDRNSNTVVGLLEQQGTLSPSDAAGSVVELNRAIGDTVAALGYLSQMLRHQEAFGIDVSEQRDALTFRIREGAEMLAVAIQLDAEELQKLRYKLTLAPDDADTQTLVRIADERRKGFARNLGAISDLLADLDVDPSQYRSMVLIVTGDVASQILDTGVMSSLAKEWSVRGLEWINDNGLGWAIKLIMFIAILMVFRSLAKLTRRWVQRGMVKVNLSVLLQHMIVSTAANLVMILGIMIALSQLGISLGPLLAGLGVLGFIIGFALQDTLGNLASGMMILIYRPYDVGDVIEAGGVMGKVADMSLVYTVINTFDNQTMVVPNNKIWGDVIRNVTSQQIRRVDLVFGISYQDDIEKAEQVLRNIVEQHELTLDDPAPTIKVNALGDSSVDFIVRPWVKSEDYWDVYWDLTREVKMRFDKEGISIPFPQRDVHVIGGPPPA